MDQAFIQQMQAHKDTLTEEDHKQAGTAVSGPIGDDHQSFLKHLFELIDNKEIDTYVPSSFLNADVYTGLTEEQQDKIDYQMINIANQIRLIDNFRQTKGYETSIHFHTMVEHLWEMRNRIEIDNDIFKF